MGFKKFIWTKKIVNIYRRLQQISDGHSSDITKLLQSLVEKGFLITNNKAGRGTVYYLNKNYKDSSVDSRVNSIDNGINSVGKELQ